MERPIVFSDHEGAFSGELYVRLLREIHRQSASGLLIVERGRAVKKIYVGNGFIIYAKSNLPEERLGDILLRKGLITREQFDRSSELIRSTGKKQGTILAQMGALSPKELFRGLILQVMEITTEPLAWPDGRYRFAASYDREEELITLKINPATVIKEGIIKLPPSPDEMLLADRAFAAADSPFIPEEIGLSPLEKKILTTVPRGKSPRDIAAFTSLPLAAVAKSFQVLIALELLREEFPAAPASIPVPPAPQPVETVAPPASKPPEEDLFSPEELRLRTELHDFHARIPKLSHYQLLDVAADCGPAEIKRAYIKKAKEYHPDRFYRPDMQDLSPVANEIFMRINEAFTVLSDDQRRREYTKSLTSLGADSPIDQARKDSVLATEQFKKGQALARAGEHWEASDAFRWAVRLCPDNPLFHSALGMALMETGRRLKEAEENLKTAIALDYNNPHYYVNLGLIYRKGRIEEKAIDSFKRALRLDPHNAEALKALAGGGDRKEHPAEESSSLLKKIFGN